MTGMLKKFSLLFLLVAVCYAALRSDDLFFATSHTVEEGDTLSEIAARYGTTVEELVRINSERYPSLRENPNLIKVGWELFLPSSLGSWLRGLVVTPTPLKRERRFLVGSPHSSYAYVPEDFDLRRAEEEVVLRVNQEREKAGLQTLSVHPVLMEVARERAKQMVELKLFSHYGPNGEYLPSEVAKEFGINKWIWENGGASRLPSPSRSAAQVVRSWMGSPGHRRAILEPSLRFIGVGACRFSHGLRRGGRMIMGTGVVYALCMMK
jgi:murein DD-endopeptidase MepM/ murein hydrolase activator NlpD